MNATADLTVIGLGRSDPSAGEYIAEIQRRLSAQDKVRYKLHAMGTSLEGSTEDKKMVPNIVPMGDGVLEVVSMGFLVDKEESALMWRGLMLNRAVQHFLEGHTVKER